MPEFDEEERGTASRGTQNRSGRIVQRRYSLTQDPWSYPAVPSISASRGVPISAAEEIAVARETRDLEEERKKEFKEENPRWAWSPSVQSQANRQGIYFTDAEIREEVGGYFGYVPGTIGVAATLIALAASLKRALEVGDTGAMTTVGWSVVEQIAAQVMVAVVEKKLKVAEARALLEKLFAETGLDAAIAKQAARILVDVQRVAASEFRRLMKTEKFRALSASKRGTGWGERVAALLDGFNKTQKGKETGFYFTFGDRHRENLLALGSGEHHEGPNVDLVLHYNMTVVMRIDLKLSTNAVSPDRTQTFMLIKDALELDLPTIYMTPDRIVILPTIESGVVIPIGLLRNG